MPLNGIFTLWIIIILIIIRMQKLGGVELRMFKSSRMIISEDGEDCWICSGQVSGVVKEWHVIVRVGRVVETD